MYNYLILTAVLYCQLRQLSLYMFRQCLLIPAAFVNTSLCNEFLIMLK